MRAGIMKHARRLAVVKQFAGVVSVGIFNVLVASVTTYIYAEWAIDQAYLQRGYKAYGGEYLIIPFVFYMVFKAAMLAEWLGYVVKKWILQKEKQVSKLRR